MRTFSIRFDTDLKLDFEIESTVIADLWLEKFEQRHCWPLDDASRFYGLKSYTHEKQRAARDLRQCIDVINAYQPIIDPALVDQAAQDSLNYLHSIFERYHGLLDQQNTAWWLAAPESVRQALCNLNIAVHRMESVDHNLPRIVCTWFGMPKTMVMDPELMRKHGSLMYEWGGVYLNYVEIGKTLEDLAHDNDRWIGDDAFQPFRHYSADFNIRFYDMTADVDLVRGYWQQHQDFFASQGIFHWDDAGAFPYRFKIAQLRTDQPRPWILAQLAQVDHIVKIHLE